MSEQINQNQPVQEEVSLSELLQVRRDKLAELQRDMKYYELSGLPAFNDAYMEAMMFPEED